MALHGRVADVVLVHLWASDLGRAVPATRRALAALFAEYAAPAGPTTRAAAAAAPTTGARKPVVVVVHDADDAGAGAGGSADLRDAVTADLEAVWVR